MATHAFVFSVSENPMDRRAQGYSPWDYRESDAQHSITHPNQSI